MKKLSTEIAAALLVFFCLTINAQEKSKDFEFTELQTEKSANSEFDKNFNEGIKHYNAAVVELRSKTEISAEKLDALQKSTLDEFKKALSYFENAYKINPKDKSVLEALSGCYFALNDNANFEKYKKELHELGK